MGMSVEPRQGGAAPLRVVPDTAVHRAQWAHLLMRAGKLWDAWGILTALDGDGSDPAFNRHLAKLRTLCAARLTEEDGTAEVFATVAECQAALVALEPKVAEHRLTWAQLLIRAEREEEAWDILAALEDETRGDPKLHRRVLRNASRCATQMAASIQYVTGGNSVEGIDWLAVATWRERALAMCPPDLDVYRYVLFNAARQYVLALVYMFRLDDARRVVADLTARYGDEEELRAIAASIGNIARQIGDERGVFAREAPRYIARGIPVVPIIGKQALPQGWEDWGRSMPGPERYAPYLSNRWATIGVVLGPLSGLSMIDIDTDDPDLIEALLAVLPPSPWRRRGRKGFALAYRWSGLASFRCLGANGQSILDHLSMDCQIVLPPSTHPETGEPYTANADLLDVIDRLHALPDDLTERVLAVTNHTGKTLPLYRRTPRQERHAGDTAQHRKSA